MTLCTPVLTRLASCHLIPQSRCAAAHRRTDQRALLAARGGTDTSTRTSRDADDGGALLPAALRRSLVLDDVIVVDHAPGLGPAVLGFLVLRS